MAAETLSQILSTPHVTKQTTLADATMVQSAIFEMHTLQLRPQAAPRYSWGSVRAEVRSIRNYASSGPAQPRWPSFTPISYTKVLKNLRFRRGSFRS